VLDDPWISEMRALGQDRSCFMCGSQDHQLRTCPLREKLKDPSVRRQLGLDPNPKSAAIRQVDMDITDVPEALDSPILDFH
jgi:hypothetical protein